MRIPESKSPMQFVLEFGDRELIVDELRAGAEELGISVPQFIKRIVIDGISVALADGESEPGDDLEDFLVRNGALRAPERDFSACLGSKSGEKTQW